MLRDRNAVFAAPLLAIVSFVTLYVLRSLDDNRLTSWYWVFQHVDAVKVFIFLTAGCLSVIFLAGLAERRFPGYATALFSGGRHENLSPSILSSGRLWPSVIFAVYFLCGMIFWSIPEVNIDAARYFTQAKYLKLFGAGYFLDEWAGDIHAWTDMPLVPFLYGMIFRYLGESRICIQILTTGLFALTGLLTYKTGEALWDRETGLYGAAFLLCVPYLFTQVPLMLVDLPTMFFLLLAIYTFIRALKCGGIWPVLSSFTIFFTFITKYSIWLMLTVLPVIALVFTLRSGRSHKRMFLMRAALTFSASVVLIGLYIFVEHEVIKEQIRLLLSYQRPALGNWQESFHSTFLFQTHPFMAAFASLSVYAAVKRKDLSYLIIAWVVLIVLVLQIRRIRYIIMVFPLLALMAAYGLRSLKEMETKIIALSCAVISSLVLAIAAYLPFMQTLSMVNLKTAGEYLDSSGSSEAEVHIVQPKDQEGSLLVAVPIMDLFTRKSLIVEESGSFQRQTGEAGSSPLRFTWEFRNPPWYGNAGRSAATDTVAVISDSAEAALPSHLSARLSGFQLVKSFDEYEGIFRFRTTVRIYERNSR